MAFLKISNLTKQFDQKIVLKSINWEVNKEEFMILAGPSGCGKTTLLKVILGALKPNLGEIYLNGRRINDIPISERDIGFLPQDFGLFPHLTVKKNIAYGLEVQKFRKNVIESKVADLLEKLKLTGLENRRSSELSWGQQQRVGLARALAIPPCLLLLDEPLSSVDWSARQKISKVLQGLQNEFKITIIYVTHDIDEAFKLGDRITIMNDGVIEQCAEPIGLIRKPKTEFVASFVRQKKSLKRTRMIMDLNEEHK